VNNDALRGFLGVGAFIGGGGLILMFLQPPNSAEFVLSACSAAMGIVVVAGVMISIRLQRGRQR
jgi:hypothetical protein